jgi:hypothetical protein
MEREVCVEKCLEENVPFDWRIKKKFEVDDVMTVKKGSLGERTKKKKTRLC